MDENLTIVLTADVRQANKSVNNFQNTLNGLNSQVLSVKQNFSQLSKTNINTASVTNSFKQLTSPISTLTYSIGLLFPQFDKLVSTIQNIERLEAIDLGSKIVGAEAVQEEIQKVLQATKSYEKSVKLFNAVKRRAQERHYTDSEPQTATYVATIAEQENRGLFKDASRFAKYEADTTKAIDKLKKKITSLKASFKDLFSSQKGWAFQIKQWNSLKKAIEENGKAMATLMAYKEAFEKGTPKKRGLPRKFAFKRPADGAEVDVGNLADVQHEMKLITDSTAFLTKRLNTMFSGVKKFAATLKVTLGLLGTIFAVLLPIIALATGIKWSKEMAQINDAINDNAEKANMSTKQYQKWAFVMQMAGSDASALRGQINQLNQRLKGADSGSESAISGFNRLGISVHDANGEFRDSTELFEEAITKLQKIDNTTTRAAIAAQIFGRNASELNGVLNLSSADMDKLVRAQNALGLAATSNAIKLAGAYNDAKDVLTATMNALKTTISEGILPMLTKLIQAIIKAVAYINIFIRTIFGLSLDNDDEMSGATNSVNDYTDSLKGATKQAEKLKRTLFGFDELNILTSPDDANANSSLGIDMEDFNISDKMSDFSFLSDEDLDKIDAFRQKMKELQGMIQMITAIALILAGLYLVIHAFFGGGIVSLVLGLSVLGLGVAVGMSGEEGQTPFDKIQKAIASFYEAIQRNIMQVVTILAGLAAVIIGFMSGNPVLIGIGIAMVAVGALSFTDAEGVSLFDKIKMLIANNIDVIKQNAMQIAMILIGLASVIMGVLSGNIPFIVLGAALIGIGTLALQDASGNNIFQGVIDAINNFILEYQGLIVGLSGFIGLICLIVGLLWANIGLIIAGVAGIGLAIYAGSVEDSQGKSLFDKVIEAANNFILEYQAIIAGVTAFIGLVLVIIGCFGNIPLLLIGLGMLGIAAGIASMEDENGNSLFDKLIEKIKSKWEELKAWFNSTVAQVFTAQFWLNLLQQIIDAFNQFFENLKQKVADFCSGLISKIADTVKNVIQSIRDAFKSEEKSQRENITSSGRGSNSRYKSMARVRAVSQEFSNLSIPKLASGGVITRPTVVQVGEYQGAGSSNPEIVSPKSIMRDTMESANLGVINAIYAIGNQISKTVEDKDSNVYMDGDIITRKVTKKQKEQARYNSTSMVTIG